MFTVHSGSTAAQPERWLEPSAQREVLDGLAELIEKNYVFSDVGGRCADDLRSSTTEGAGVSASRLARQLTTRLRVHDRHFSVSWGEPDRLRVHDRHFSVSWGEPDRLRVTDRERSGEDAMTFQRRGSGGVLTIRRFGICQGE